MVRRSLAMLAMCAAVGAASCDEEPNAKPEKSAAQTAAPVPTPPPAETEKPKPAKPKKTAEDCGPGPSVAFDDKAIEEELRKKLQKPTGDITRADLGRLKSLNLSQLTIDQLDPCLLPHANNLKELFLGKGELDDLTPLAGLTKLESLRASINQVKDLTPLAELTRLDRLDLGRTQVEDLKPLAGLANLTELALDDTPVSDLTPLAKLTKLERLSVQRTRVKDFSPIKDLKSLKFVYIAGTPAPDIKALEPLRSGGTKIIDQ